MYCSIFAVGIYGFIRFLHSNTETGKTNVIGIVDVAFPIFLFVKMLDLYIRWLIGKTKNERTIYARSQLILYIVSHNRWYIGIDTQHLLWSFFITNSSPGTKMLYKNTLCLHSHLDHVMVIVLRTNLSVSEISIMPSRAVMTSSIVIVIVVIGLTWCFDNRIVVSR